MAEDAQFTQVQLYNPKCQALFSEVCFGSLLLWAKLFFSGPDAAVLARVKNELQKYHQENRGLIKVVRDALNEYESKITDLREALNDATGQIKQAEGLNRDNTVLLEGLKVMSGFRRKKLNLRKWEVVLVAASDLTKPSSTNSLDFIQGLFPSSGVCMDRYKCSVLLLMASLCDQNTVTKTKLWWEEGRKVSS